MSAADTRLDSIDQLRAVAMLAVVTQHCGLLPMGWTGVWLFFVISGYVITLGIIRRGGDDAPFAQRYRAFMALRASRIVPALVVYLLVCGAILALRGQGEAWLAHAPAVIAFIFNGWMIATPDGLPSIPPPLGHLWTISVEQQFYLLFPLLAMAAPARWRVPLCWALVIASPLLRWATSAAWQLHEPGADHPTEVYMATFCHLDAFVAGALIAYGTAHRPSAGAVQTRLRRLTVVGLAVALVYAGVYVTINQQLGASGWRVLMNVYSGILYGQHREVFVYVPVVLLASALVLHATTRTGAATTVAGRVMAWIGRISYSGYLVHLLVIWLVLPLFGSGSARALPLGRWLAFYVTVLLLTLAVSHLMYHGVERPAQRWLRRRRSPKGVPAAASAG